MKKTFELTKRRDSSVGTVTGYGLGILLFSTASRTALGPTSPASYPTCTGLLLLRCHGEWKWHDDKRRLILLPKREWEAITKITRTGCHYLYNYIISVVGFGVAQGLDDQGSLTGRVREGIIILFDAASRPALPPPPPASYPMGTGRLFFQGVTLTTYFQLAPRSRMRGVIAPLPPIRHVMVLD
jgi:hypothetical protein